MAVILKNARHRNNPRSISEQITAQKNEVFFKDIFNKFEKIHRKLRICSHLLKKSPKPDSVTFTEEVLNEKFYFLHSKKFIEGLLKVQMNLFNIFNSDFYLYVTLSSHLNDIAIKQCHLNVRKV